MTLTEIKTAALENVIRIHGNTDYDQKPTEVIDLNIKTNLTVSNSKGSKFLQKSLFVLVLFFTGTFTILLFNVRRELQALKSQEQCVETKIAILMTRYEKLNNQLTRVRSHMNYNKYYQPLTTTTTSDESKRDKNKMISVSKSRDETIFRYNKLNNGESVTLQDKNISNGTIVDKKDEPDVIISEINYEENRSFIESKKDSVVTEKDSKTNSMHEDNNRNQYGGNRFTRTILNTTDENYHATASRSVDENSTDHGSFRLNLTEENYEMINDNENDDDIDLWSEPRTSRMRRDDDRRGKIRTKNKRRPKRSRRRLGPLVATFIGGIPEQHITDRGAIGPWVKLTKDTSLYDLQKFHLVDNKRAIEITMNGLYMISAQIFYVGQQTNYSYWILLNSEGQSTTQRVTKCSAVSSIAANEVSCNTNVVLPLRRGDRLHIQQQERDRLVNLREGHSYIQLVLLSNESQRKQRTV